MKVFMCRECEDPCILISRDGDVAPPLFCPFNPGIDPVWRELEEVEEKDNIL